jgi:hypothetical protein
VCERIRFRSQRELRQTVYATLNLAVEGLSKRNTLISKGISLQKITEASVKTIAGLSVVALFLGNLLSGAQAQQNMGTPRKGIGMGEAGHTFHTPSQPRGFVTGPKALGATTPDQWGTFQTGPGARNRLARRRTR